MKEKILSNGKTIPAIGYGSGIIQINTSNTISIIGSIGKRVLKLDGKTLRTARKVYHIIKKAKEVVPSDQKVLLDTSRAYEASEYLIGKAVGRNRNKYYITTKLCNSDQYKGNVKKALQKSLQQLKMEKVDLYLMHWPVTEIFIQSWKQMEECYEEGLCEAIGVCNCNIHHLELIKKHCKIMPMVNQIECHPLFTQEKLREYCHSNNIQVMAYTATARMDERLRKTCLVAIAKKHNKTLPEIILRWHIQIGNIPIFNTSKMKNYMENMDIFDFELTREEIEQISKININSRLRYDPDNCDFKKL